ncbi:hypothetical protein BZA05DRAFT_377496 [Tricharina praecox]|uniref:uncharacterized protein n=1 Tax=Tricharina praecox TaxID=43433 RepID=UPI0022210F37|nr:uncharacterized protein BZA05DRAFT_377496 [Tricharina praecox]KAI5846055.1 hypothetical protein BZA05DRAFT_377496 [Tricharina praecox]
MNTTSDRERDRDRDSLLHHISREDLSYIAHTQRTLRPRPPPPSSSSTAASHSSSHTSAGISLDPQALSQLSSHFDALLSSITSRVESLSSQTLKSTTAHHRRANSVAEQANREIERLREILRQCDELQNEFLKIKRIGEIVKGFRKRVEVLEGRIGK